MENVLKSLELDKIKSIVSGYCVLDGGKEIIDGLLPAESYEDCRFELDRTDEAYRLLFIGGVSSIEYFDDIGDSLTRAKKGSALSMGELLRCARLMRSARILYTSVTASVVDAPILKSEISGIYVDQYVENEIFSKILSEDTVSDNASERLFSIRKMIKRLNEQIRDRLQSYIKSGKDGYLQENIVTMRGDRYVIPVKSEHKNKIGGFIHDRSVTGSTLFIEPTEVLEMNNELKSAKIDEQLEIERILYDLSVKIGMISDRLEQNLQIAYGIDAVYAKATYAYKTKSIRPELNASGVIDIRNGRHPLIPKDRVVPVSLSLGESYNYLLISGPNTGGKTVSLKMTGLFTAMTMCGMFISASEGSKISCFDKIFCDIGDYQSIENSLSTFSSHIKNIIDITRSVDDKSLVLIDELGAGTDPDEGSALATAVIGYLLDKNSFGIVTTHYSTLKEYAYGEKKIMNASMAFDERTFSPMYKINIGVPGCSNALEISRLLGLDSEIIDKATGYIGNEKLSFDKILRAAEKSRQETDALKLEIQEIRDREKHALDEIDAEREKLDREKEKFYAKARAESRRIVNEKLEEADGIIEEIKALFDKEEISDGDLIKARSLRNKLEDKKYALEDDDKKPVRYSPADINSLKVGDSVYYAPMETVCTVNSVNKPKGECEIFVGSARIRCKIKDVFYVSDGKENKTTVSFKREIKSAMTNEINVVGLTVDEALREVDGFLDSAVINNAEVVKIVHGKGLNILNNAIHAYLKKDKRVEEYRYGKYGEGERGVTFVKLK